MRSVLTQQNKIADFNLDRLRLIPFNDFNEKPCIISIISIPLKKKKINILGFNRYLVILF